MSWRAHSSTQAKTSKARNGPVRRAPRIDVEELAGSAAADHIDHIRKIAGIDHIDRIAAPAGSGIGPS